MGEPFRPVAPGGTANLRPMLFLEAARDIMLNEDWPFRAVTVVMEDHGGPAGSRSTAPTTPKRSRRCTRAGWTSRSSTRPPC